MIDRHVSLDRNVRARTGQHTRQRRGAFLVIVLVCLLVATILLGSLLRLALAHDRGASFEQARLQAEWLALSGLARAAARLSADPAYRGEQWKLEPGQLGTRQAGEVRIRVEESSERSGERTIVAEAVYPAETSRAVRRTRESRVRITQENEP